MTTQSAEIIFIEGESYTLFEEPLESYWTSLRKKPEFMAPNTACWRGYYGTWTIEDGKLYLLKIETENESLTKQSIFPLIKGPVFAEWYSGELRIPRGECLKYVHGGFGSIYERDILLTVKKGKVISHKIKTNRVSKEDLRDPYGIFEDE